MIAAPSEKSLQIILVRDVDGKTFWDALDDAISPRIKAPSPIDEVALSKFRSVFQNRPLNKGTFIFLTWLDRSRLLVSLRSIYTHTHTHTHDEFESELTMRSFLFQFRQFLMSLFLSFLQSCVYDIIIELNHFNLRFLSPHKAFHQLWMLRLNLKM